MTVKCVDMPGLDPLRSLRRQGRRHTGAQSIEEIRSGGPRLADDDAFKSARDAAGMPDETAGFVWLDIEDGLPLVVGLAEASGGTPRSRRSSGGIWSRSGRSSPGSDGDGRTSSR